MYSLLLKKGNGELFFTRQALGPQRLIVCRRVNIHLLNLLDGTPYYTPPSGTIGWSFPFGVDVVTVEELAITSSRLMLFFCLWRSLVPLPIQELRICVWDWKTGDLVLTLWLE